MDFYKCLYYYKTVLNFTKDACSKNFNEEAIMC